jgi:DNA polymerase III subunit beta
MKVICTQENLKSGLSIVGRIISSTNTLPILNNLLIKTENGTLKISSTNLEVAITTQVRCKVEEEGVTTVVNKTLNDLVSNLPNKNIVLQTSQNQLNLETENYHTSIKTLPGEEFPLIPEIEIKKAINIDSQEIKNAIDSVVFAVSTNQTQPEISGVLFKLEQDKLLIVATDRYRLAEKTVTLQTKNNNSQDIIIPHKTAQELSRIIGSQKGEVEIMFNETQVSFVFNNTQIISRLVDGQYPDYKQIIPSEFPANLVIEKQSLVSALRTGSVFNQGNNSVKFDFSVEKQQLILVTESSELGKSIVELPAEIQGKPKAMILNHHYILDCLAHITSPNIIIKLIDDNSPSLIIPQGEEGYVYLVMPIKS